MINLGLSCVSNLLQVIVAEETMVLAHNFMQNEEVSCIDFYVKMNLNIKYISEVILATLNIKKKKVEWNSSVLDFLRLLQIRRLLLNLWLFLYLSLHHGFHSHLEVGIS